MAKVLRHVLVEADYPVWDLEYNLKLGGTSWMASWLRQCYRCTENPAEEEFVDLFKEIDWVMLNKIRNMNAQIDTE